MSFTCQASVSILWNNADIELSQTDTSKTTTQASTINGVLFTYSSLSKQHAFITPEASAASPLSRSQTLLTIYPETTKPKEYIIEDMSFHAVVPSKLGTFVIGGSKGKINKVRLYRWDSVQQKLLTLSLADLPVTTDSASAAILGDYLYVLTDDKHQNELYRLAIEDISVDAIISSRQSTVTASEENSLSAVWEKQPRLPIYNKEANARYGMKLVVQHDGNSEHLYAFGGYYVFNHAMDDTKPLAMSGEQNDIRSNQEIWKLETSATSNDSTWAYQGDMPLATTEGPSGITDVKALGQSHILAFGKNLSPLAFNTITKSWTRYEVADLQNDKIFMGKAPTILNTFLYNNQIHALVSFTDPSPIITIIKASIKNKALHFGWQNMTVLVGYLILVVFVGLFFVFKNKNTDDYFRGGQSIPWWAAACSIYATMLSSLTYVALPAIVYQTNWLLLIGIWMIIFVAPVAIYIAMPFFRQIDATSAYEYLSKRFNMSVRLFASGLFSLFHIGRMGIVMALTALALSAVTPLTASESVLIMGILCLIYCTLGGIEAVIWTDTLQTVVLIIGAVICFITILLNVDGGLFSFINIGFSDQKFTMVDFDFSLDSMTTLSIWVIVIGGIGQNLSSYTADQAIVQRYMVTSDPAAARKSIWANAVIAAPGALLFFCIGTGLYVFYKTHPGELDPNIQIDQIFPTFIATELPVGLAGLIVAGIFAAAQSTVSTSMNSIATTIVTDFIRPFNIVQSEKSYMNLARLLTFITGLLGTLAGLIFIDPEIRSLMEAYFKVIGMFMGALGGLFVLGVMTKKANAIGATLGIFCGVATMISAWKLGWANGYLYATIGIVSCLVVGYLTSLLFKSPEKDLKGLTLYTMHTSNQTHL